MRQEVVSRDAASGDDIDDLDLVGVCDKAADLEAFGIQVGLESGEGTRVFAQGGVFEVGMEISIEQAGLTVIQAQVEFVAGLGVKPAPAFIAVDRILVLRIRIGRIFAEEVIAFRLMGIIGCGQQQVFADFSFGKEGTPESP